MYSSVNCQLDYYDSKNYVILIMARLPTLNFTINQVLNEGIVRSGASAAASVVLVIVPIIVFIVSQSKIVETMGSSGMKD